MSVFRKIKLLYLTEVGMPFCVEGALVYSSGFAYHKPCSHNPRLY